MTISDRAGRVPPREASIAFRGEVQYLAALEGDAAGRVIVVGGLAPRDAELKSGTGVEETMEVIVFGRDLEVQRRFFVPRSAGPWEQEREFALGPDGALYQLAFTDSGVEVRRWPL
jgi:hypothetical protein